MVILIQCKDRVGLVATIAGLLAQKNINIVSMREHVDTVANHFFVRIVAEQQTDATVLLNDFQTVLPKDALISVNPDPEKKIILLVTKEYHCLSDILVRNHFKTLGAKIQCVIGNHDVLQDICTRFEIPFFLVSCNIYRVVSGFVNRYTFDVRILFFKREFRYLFLLINNNRRFLFMLFLF